MHCWYVRSLRNLYSLENSGNVKKSSWYANGFSENSFRRSFRLYPILANSLKSTNWSLRKTWYFGIFSSSWTIGTSLSVNLMVLVGSFSRWNCLVKNSEFIFQKSGSLYECMKIKNSEKIFNFTFIFSRKMSHLENPSNRQFLDHWEKWGSQIAEMQGSCGVLGSGKQRIRQGTVTFLLWALIFVLSFLRWRVLMQIPDVLELGLVTGASGCQH